MVDDVTLNKAATIERCLARVREEYGDGSELDDMRRQDALVLNLLRACALRWTDLDLINGSLSVQRAVTRGEDGTAILAEPKTTKSCRTVPMLGGLRDALVMHLDWQREQNLDMAGFVFTNQDGLMLHPIDVQQARPAPHAEGRQDNEAHHAVQLPAHVWNVAPAGRHGTEDRQRPLGALDHPAGGNTFMHGDTAVTFDWMQRFEQSLATTDESRSTAAVT